MPFEIYIKLNVLVLLLLGFISVSAQTTYYVSAAGNDAAAGTSTTTAWKTLAKVNAATFASGDNVLLRRGDTFTDQLRIRTAGLKVDAYGTGNKPIISGADQITTVWTVNSGNIWETTFSSGKPALMNNLLDGSVILPISRYPNKSVNNGYLNFETHSGSTQFTDTGLGGTPNWAGSDIVVRAERFRLVRTKVSAHSGNTITLPAAGGLSELVNGYGYFFVNDLKAIDLEGEWAYVPATGKVYLYSAVNPNTKTLYYPKTDTTVYINSAANASLKNVDIRNAGKIGLCVRSSSNTLVDSVDISASGGDGVIYNASSGGTFQNSTIDRVNGTGMLTNATSNQLIIQNNVVTNSGNEAFGKSKTFIGIDCNSPNCQILNNKISKTGYTGIISAGLNNLVKRNLVDSICLYLEDMGGIYTNNNIGVTTGTIIEENIVTNSIGEMLGAPGEFSKANGIYLDNLTQGVTVRNNTVAFINGSGLFTNATQADNQIYNNTSYQSGVNELVFNNPTIAPHYNVKENILVTNSVAADHNVVQANKTQAYSYEEMGTFTDNYIVNPFNSKTISFLFNDNGVTKTVRYSPYEWEAYVKQVNGTVSAYKPYTSGTVPADVIKFYYNPSSSSQSYTLPSGQFVDALNQAYCGSVTLAPFKSVVLFKTGTGSCSTPVACGLVTSPAIVSSTDSSANLSWTAVSGALNYDVRYRELGESVWKYASNIQTNSTSIIGLSGLTTYESQVRSSCYGSEGAWVNFAIFTTSKAPAKHVFINATLANCSPSTSFAAPHSDTDNKWTLMNSGGIGTVDTDMMRSSSVSEDSPEITLSATGVLDACSTYDVYLYYSSPASQPWKTKAKLTGSSTMLIFDRNTVGAELLADHNGTSDRLYRAKIGSVSAATGFSVIIDDYNYGSSSARCVFDGVGYIKTGEVVPDAPTALQVSQNFLTRSMLTWTDNSATETGFVIERKTLDNPFQTLVSVAANTTSFTDSTIVADSTYFYRIYATAGTCKSDPSNVATPYQFRFINASYSNCSPATAFATTHADTDNKWTVQNSGGIGTLDGDLMRSSSVSEDSPEITLTASGVLNDCATYDIYLYYLSPASQPWKTKAKMAGASTMIIFDRNTPGAELIPDRNGSFDRLYRAKIGTVSGSANFSVVIDDYDYGSTSARCAFDGVAYIQTGGCQLSNAMSMQENDTLPVSLMEFKAEKMDRQVKLEWTTGDEKNSDYFMVERTDDGINYKPLGAIIKAAGNSRKPNSYSITDRNPLSGMNYYRLTAVNSDGKKEAFSTLTYLNPMDNTEILIYPNPFDDQFNIKLDAANESSYSIRLIDLSGKVLINKKIAVGNGAIKIDASTHPSGIYLLEVYKNNGTIKTSFKLVKR